MKNYFFENLITPQKKKILIIFTGGTISMIKDRKTGSLIPADTLEDLFKSEPELKEIADLEFINLFNLDSSDLNADHWQTIAEIIIKNYERFDGFVIAHGTDTMAYTASALSFLLENLSKAVIITGSQFPLSGGMRTDARMNLYNAILFAQTDLAEVAICFGNKLLRGNRSTKLNAVKLDAFVSPNYPTIGSIDTKISIKTDKYKKINKKAKLIGYCADNIMFLKIHPGINPDILNSIPESIRGIIIEGFGSGGNIPQNILEAIKNKIRKQSTIIALKSQCIIGNIDLNLYEGGRRAREQGVLNCMDMTSEAAICKLSWLLGQNYDTKKIKYLFERNLRGELSTEQDE